MIGQRQPSAIAAGEPGGGLCFIVVFVQISPEAVFLSRLRDVHCDALHKATLHQAAYCNHHDAPRLHCFRILRKAV